MGSLVTFHTVRVVLAFGLCLALPGCLKPIPRVAIPAGDASPPVLTWQLYNMQTKERREISQDGQTIDVPSTEQYVVTLAGEDVNSGVKEVTLSGKVQFKCEQAAQVEEKKYDLDRQAQTAAPDQENKVPIQASLVQAVEVNKYGCKEYWTFGGVTMSLEGKAQNFVNGVQMKTLKLNLKR